MARAPTTGGTTHRATSKWARATSNPKVVTAVLIAAAALWFILVNRGQVGIYLWVPKVLAPMWLVLLITFGGGLITGLLLRRNQNKKQQ